MTKELLTANTDFYKAFSMGDIEAMARIWAEDDTISCIHPGWPALIGLRPVLDSWRDILSSPGRPRIICHDPQAIIAGDDGRILCIEAVEGGALAATNLFRRINSIWRMVHHQASPVAITSPPEDRAPPSARMH